MLLMTTQDRDGDGQSASDLRELSFLKNNYGPLAESIVLRFRNGLFLPEAGQSALEKLARDQKVDETFLDVLGKLVKQNRPANPSADASNYGPKVIADHPDGKAYTQRDYRAALERLLAANRVHIASFGPRSKTVRHLRLDRPDRRSDGPSRLPSWFLPVLPGWGVRCSRSYREGGHRTSLPIGPTTAAKPGRAKRRAHNSRPTIGRTG